MKRIITLFTALAMWSATTAQEITPSRFQGADANRFIARLIGEAEKIAEQKQIPAAEISTQATVGFTVDTAGCVTNWRFLDNTCEGRDYVDVEPITPPTREIMTEALAQLEAWTPAQQDGRPAPYNWRLTMRLPVEKIAKKQEADPLLFLGGDPDKKFHEWVSVRIRYDGRYSKPGSEGLVHVRFYVEPDARISIGEVVQSPDDKLSREVIRVIRSSKGKWLPRKVRGVAQRTAYDYRINFFK